MYTHIYIYLYARTYVCIYIYMRRRVAGRRPENRKEDTDTVKYGEGLGMGPYMYMLTVPRAQALLRGRAWVAQLWAKSVGAVRLRALLFCLVQQGCLRFGVSRCGLAAAVVGGGVRCFVGVNLSSSIYRKTSMRASGSASGP